jgi:DNA-directed RNA polymerase subunit delta
MTNRSMTDVAFDVLKNLGKEIPFVELWGDVCATFGFNTTQAENKIATFFSAMTLDVRFAPLPDGMWDLRSRRTYNETHVDTDAILIEEELIKEDDLMAAVSDEPDDEFDKPFHEKVVVEEEDF